MTPDEHYKRGEAAMARADAELDRHEAMTQATLALAHFTAALYRPDIGVTYHGLQDAEPDTIG